MNLINNTLYIVSTPIGNLDDITLRAVKVLSNSDIILCEDTRHSLKLLNHLKIKKKLVSYHKFNERKKTTEVIQYINKGKILSLISDAGTPLLSDPGRILINDCVKENINIVPIPGVSSITTAMSVSGFKDQFLFYGFLPKTNNEVNKLFITLTNISYSQVFFIPAIKFNFYIKYFKKYFKGRKIFIGKEMTKVHEFFIREDIDNFKIFKNLNKGELTVIISDKPINSKEFNETDIIIKAKKFFKNYSLKDTVNLISVSEKINKKTIYEICLKIKNEKTS